MFIQMHPLRRAATAYLPTAEYRFGFPTYLVVSKNDAKTSLCFAGIVKISIALMFVQYSGITSIALAQLPVRPGQESRRAMSRPNQLVADE